MRERAAHYLTLLSVPLLLLAVSLTLRVSWQAFDLPEGAALAEIVGGWLQRYGLPVLFLAALAEGTLLVGGYFPGIFVITVSVIVARSWQEAVTAVVIGSLGLIAAHALNYQLGRHGWYRLLARFGLKSSIESARHRLERKGPVAVFGTYWLPSLAALTDTAAGILRVPFGRFMLYSVAATLAWDALAGSLMYVLGGQAIGLASPRGTDLRIVLAVIGAWMIILIVRDRNRGKATA